MEKAFSKGGIIGLVLLAATFAPGVVLGASENPACVDPQAFWNRLAAGVHPAPEVLPGPPSAWELMNITVNWVVVGAEGENVTRGVDVGFRLFRANGSSPAAPALLWGTPDKISGWVGEEDTDPTYVVSAPDSAGLLCLELVAPMGHDADCESDNELGVNLCDQWHIPGDAIPAGPPLQVATTVDICTFDDGRLLVCAVGDVEFCEGDADGGSWTYENAWDKMTNIIFPGWDTFHAQTIANDWAGVWLKCYLHAGGDPFAGVANPQVALRDFEANEGWRPDGDLSIMHLFSTTVRGGSGQCEDNAGNIGKWSVGGYHYTIGSETPALVEKNLWLHEVGHVFNAAHEVGDSSCARQTAQAAQWNNGKFSIMSTVVPGGDADKVRLFTDGVNHAFSDTRDNVCWIDRNTKLRLGNSVGPCPPFSPLL